MLNWLHVTKVLLISHFALQYRTVTPNLSLEVNQFCRCKVPLNNSNSTPSPFRRPFGDAAGPTKGSEAHHCFLIFPFHPEPKYLGYSH